MACARLTGAWWAGGSVQEHEQHQCTPATRVEEGPGNGVDSGLPGPSCPDMGNQDQFAATGPAAPALHEVLCATNEAGRLSRWSVAYDLTRCRPVQPERVTASPRHGV